MTRPQNALSRTSRRRTLKRDELGPPAGLEAYTFEVADDEYAVFAFPIPDIELPLELSVAEREVASALIEGRSNKEIAKQRGTSHHTVANQLRSIYRKLGVPSRVELIRRCGAPHAGK